MEDNVNILNSRLKMINNTYYIQLEISPLYPNSLNTCIIHNQTMFLREANNKLQYNMKADTLAKAYTKILVSLLKYSDEHSSKVDQMSIKSSYSNKSFLLSLDRKSVHSLDWNSGIQAYQFFDSFKKNELHEIDIIANDVDNKIAIIHIREDDSIYLIHREFELSQNSVLA